MLDAHVHVWEPGTAQYTWLTEELAPLDRTVLLDEYSPPSDAMVHGVVLVQAADNAADTAVMRAQAARDTRVVAVVAWAPLDETDVSSALFEDYSRDPLIVGVRNLIHLREPSWLAHPQQRASLDLLAAHGLTLDFVTDGFDALKEIPELGERHPELRIVIDHLGKPPIAGDEEERARWRSLLQEAADNPRVFAKLSGLVPPRGSAPPMANDVVRPFVEEALEVFGADRLMFGSDWPLVERAGGLNSALRSVSSIVGERGSAAHGAVFSGTASRFYEIHAGRI